MKEITLNDYTLKIGQNVHENDELLRAMNLSHTWFHILEHPSAHLWIDADYHSLTKAQIYKCALELKKSGKFKKYQALPIMYTTGKNLELTSTPGKVNVSSYKTINV